jgi:glycosyltransferase involved in cell wall biosynthesis
MRILYGCTSYPPAIGGAQLHLHQLVSGVQRAGHDVRVITHATRYRTDWIRLATTRSDPRETLEHEGITVERFGYDNRTRWAMLPWVHVYYPVLPVAARVLAGLMHRRFETIGFDADVVHVSRVGREFYAMALLRWARRHAVPFVLTPNHHPRWRGYWYREWDRLYRSADALIVLTPTERRMMVEEKGVDPDRVHVTGIGPIVSPTCDVDRLRRKHGLSGRFVLYLGQQRTYKGVELFMRAGPIVWSTHGDVRLVVAGPRSPEADACADAVRDERLINLAEVDLSTKTALLAAAEAVVLPSRQESFGGVFVEAWSQGTPVVGGRIGPIADVIDDGVDGWLCDFTAQSVASRIKALLDDPIRARAMGEAGRAKVRARFDWPRLVDATLQIYEQAAARHHP